MKILYAKHQGFCSGVKRALKLAQTELQNKAAGQPLYLLHGLVHNEAVTASLERQGARIVETLDGLPSGAKVLISAHGTTPETFETAKRRNLIAVDATCPLVRAVQKKAEELAESGYTVLLFGDKKHREVEGILGHCNGVCEVLETAEDAERFQPRPGVRYGSLSQTTWNAKQVQKMVEILQKKIPDLRAEGNVCNATDERQNAVRALAAQCDAVTVIGSATSSNTVRLAEIAKEILPRVYLVPDVNAVSKEMTDGVENMGIASGASAPDELVTAITDKLKELAQ